MILGKIRIQGQSHESAFTGGGNFQYHPWFGAELSPLNDANTPRSFGDKNAAIRSEIDRPQGVQTGGYGFDTEVLGSSDGLAVGWPAGSNDQAQQQEVVEFHMHYGAALIVAAVGSTPMGCLGHGRRLLPDLPQVRRVRIADAVLLKNLSRRFQ